MRKPRPPHLYLKKMVKKTGPTNLELVHLIRDLKKLSIDKKVKIWKRIAEDLSASTRSRRSVNLYHISNYVRENETIVVPGKVLGTGELDHKAVIAAFSFSKSAVVKIQTSGGSALSLSELMKNNPEGKKLRIIG